MKGSGWRALVVLCGSVTIADVGCGRSALGGAVADAPTDGARVGATDAVAYVPAAPTPDASLATDATTNCTQAQRSSAPCPSSQWYAFQGDVHCTCLFTTEPGCSSMVHNICTSRGDGLCYLSCQSNADCTDTCFPFCRRLLLYTGTEQCGASSHSVCLRADQDTCDPGADRL